MATIFVGIETLSRLSIFRSVVAVNFLNSRRRDASLETSNSVDIVSGREMSYISVQC